MADDPQAVRRHAESQGVQIGSVNPNCFQDREYWMGSITSRDPKVREKAVRHMCDSIALGEALGSNLLSLWFADGTDYPGQGDFRQRKRWAQECLQAAYDLHRAERRLKKTAVRRLWKAGSDRGRRVA